jgi:hypothetical protein
MSEGDERGRSFHGIVACVAAAMLLGAIYVGSYLALSDPWTFYSPGGVERSQSFRFGGEAAKAIFWPLTQFDMLVRPDYWRP